MSYVYEDALRRSSALSRDGSYFGGKLASIPSTAFVSSPEDASVLIFPRARPCQTSWLSSARATFSVSTCRS